MTGKLPPNPKDIAGSSKPDLSLIPPVASVHEARAMMDGAVKYGPYNWRGAPVQALTYAAACMRHVQQWVDGEERDPVSKVHHLGHARACLGILLDAIECEMLIDNRPAPGRVGDVIRRETLPSAVVYRASGAPPAAVPVGCSVEAAPTLREKEIARVGDLQHSMRNCDTERVSWQSRRFYLERVDDGWWRAVLPDGTGAGTGGTARDALNSAVRLLGDGT